MLNFTIQTELPTLNKADGLKYRNKFYQKERPYKKVGFLSNKKFQISHTLYLPEKNCYKANLYIPVNDTKLMYVFYVRI